MKTTRVMSLVTAAVFALGMAGSALAQTPTTPAPSTTPAPNAPAKGDSMDKMDKKDGKGATKHTAKKKHAVKKSEGRDQGAGHQGARAAEEVAGQPAARRLPRVHIGAAWGEHLHAARLALSIRPPRSDQRAAGPSGSFRSRSSASPPPP